MEANDVVHVEVLQSAKSARRSRDIELYVRTYLQQQSFIYNNSVFENCHFKDDLLKENVEKISVFNCYCSPGERQLVTNDFLNNCQIHIYRLADDEPWSEKLESDGNGDNEDAVAVTNHWVLPNKHFEGLWDHLIFDINIKEEILSYVESMMLFSDRKVSPQVVTSNRMLLFHGPPGTGKTTLCKAIAQKLCIRLNHRYSSGSLVEVNSHSLFSKWFSESGKQVMKMFEKIHQLLEDDSSLVMVLIDEVESLTVARKQSLSGNEPSDAVRVVNALLTQLDYIRRWPNVLILTTSNLSEAVDPAFLDRADIKQYIGPPSPFAIYKIFYEILVELQHSGIINDTNVNLHLAPGPTFLDNEAGRMSQKLYEIAEQCYGMSGRSLRKLPVIAHAFKLRRKSVSLTEFIDALAFAAHRHLESEKRSSGSNSNACGKSMSFGDQNLHN